MEKKRRGRCCEFSHHRCFLFDRPEKEKVVGCGPFYAIRRRSPQFLGVPFDFCLIFVFAYFACSKPCGPSGGCGL